MKRSKKQFGIRLVLLASLLTIASTSAQEASKEKVADEKKSAVKADPAAIAKLIGQLGSDDFQTREKASRRLAELDEVPDALRRAAQDSDREISRRAQDAIKIITNRIEVREFRAMLRDLHKVELDRFVRRMVTDKDFAGDKQWKIIQTVAKAVTAEANKIAGRTNKVPDFSANKMRRLLLSAETKNPLAISSSMLLSAGATNRIGAIDNCLVIVDGDFAGATRIANSLLIVRGNVGRVTSATDSIILATGHWVGATACNDSFVQVYNYQIRFTLCNSVLLNTLIRATDDRNSRVLKADKGPLQLVKFSPRPTDAQLTWSKEVENLTVALSPLHANGQILIRWKNVGKEPLQLPWVRFQSDSVDRNVDDLLKHVFLKGPDGKHAAARKYPAPRGPRRLLSDRCVILGPGRTHEEMIDLWTYVEKPGAAGDYQLSIELDSPAKFRGMQSEVKTWSGKIQSKTVKIAVGK